MIRGLVFITLLSLKSLALDMIDIKIMRNNGVLIAFPNESKAHIISASIRPDDLMKVNYIRLNGQSLRKIPKLLSKMTNLVKLELGDTNMDLIDLFALKSLNNLNTLNLNNNPNLFDKGGSLSELLLHFSLSELYLSNTGGSFSNCANIGNSKSLIKLDLSNNKIYSINSLHLERLKNLKSLKIVNNSISGTLDTAYLPKRSLVYLNLSNNNIHRLKYSDDFPALESLNISKNRSYLEFDEDWDDAYILKRLSKGSFNKGIALPKSIMKRLGIKSKWIDVSPSICRANGGKILNGVCKSKWSNAKKICRVSGGVLPSIKELREVVSGCSGINVTTYNKKWSEIIHRNRANKAYQNCYKAKGFLVKYHYWSSITNFNLISNAVVLNFNNGYIYYYDKDNSGFVRCVKDGQ